MLHRKYEETHCLGKVSLENLSEFGLVSACDGGPADMHNENTDLGIQIAEDGRVWLCISGIAFLRFKPNTGEREAGPLRSETMLSALRSTAYLIDEFLNLTPGQMNEGSLLEQYVGPLKTLHIEIKAAIGEEGD